MSLTEKKIRILKAAEIVISENGIDAASVREIAKEAKINTAMISYYFGSKEKLVENLFSWRISSLSNKFEDISTNISLTPFQKLSKVLEVYLNSILENPKFHCIMVREYSKKKNQAPKLIIE